MYTGPTHLYNVQLVKALRLAPKNLSGASMLSRKVETKQCQIVSYSYSVGVKVVNGSEKGGKLALAAFASGTGDQNCALVEFSWISRRPQGGLCEK